MAAVAILALATAVGIKIREDMRRNEAIRLIHAAMEFYASSDNRGENLGVLGVWETLAHAGYFGGASQPQRSRQVEVLRHLLAGPDIAEQPDSLDAILLRSALAMALVSREGNYLEGEPLAVACREQWAGLFGEEDPMARRMAVVAAAATATRLLAERDQGVAMQPGALADAREALDAAAKRLPPQDADGPVHTLYETLSRKLPRFDR